MNIIEQLHRRGAYNADIRRMVEAGVIFQMDVDGNRVALVDGVPDAELVAMAEKAEAAL